MVDKKRELNKLDVKKEYKYLYSPKKGKAEIVEVPPFKYIQIEGRGYPGTSQDFQEKVQVLYGLAYTIKFMMKKDTENPFDFTVPPLSGLWCADDMTAFTEAGRKDEWKWTLMILMPDPVVTGVFEKAREELKRKKDPLHLEEVRFGIYEEGLCAQILHLGPYDTEGPTIETLHSFFKEQGYTFNGQHHEIYLGDPRKSKPEKLKTIIRQPIIKNI